MRLLTTSLLAFSLLTGGSFAVGASSYAGEGKGKECSCAKCESGTCEHKKGKGKKGACDCCKEGGKCSAEHSHDGHSHDGAKPEGKKEEKKAE